MKYWGKYRAIVVDVKDAEKRGRVRVKCPKVLGEDKSSWCEICVPVSGENEGDFCLPFLNDTVWVEFEDGDVNKPILVGSWYSKEKSPFKKDYSDAPNERNITYRKNRIEMREESYKTICKNKIDEISQNNTTTVGGNNNVNVSGSYSSSIVGAYSNNSSTSLSYSSPGANLDLAQGLSMSSQGNKIEMKPNGDYKAEFKGGKIVQEVNDSKQEIKYKYSKQILKDNEITFEVDNVDSGKKSGVIIKEDSITLDVEGVELKLDKKALTKLKGMLG